MARMQADSATMAIADATMRMLDALPQAVAALDTGRRVIHANRAFRTLFQPGVPCIGGWTLADVVAAKADAGALGRWLDSLATGSDVSIDGHVTLRGDPVPVPCAVNACWLDDGPDSSRRILLRLEPVASGPDMPGSRLLELVSHEMRQPLQTIRFLCDVLRQRHDSGRSDAQLARLDAAAALLSEHLESLVRLQQLETGAERPAPAGIAAADLLDPLAAEFTRHAGAAGVRLRYQRSTLWFHAVPALLEWAVRGLLLHTLKHAREGSILLGCRRQTADVWIEIWSDGVQSPAPDALAESFGLALAGRLGAVLGYRVRMETLPGGLTRHAIQVPRAALLERDDTLAPGAAMETSPPRRGRILVVEDDPVLRELLEMLLDGAGYDVIPAADGREALLLATGDRRQPDMIVADYQLPHGLNGVETVRRLRAAGGGEIPAIVLSGDTSAPTGALIAEAGCQFLGKPVNGRALVSMIAATLPALGPPDASDAIPGPSQPCAGANAIIVIEDEPAVAETMRDLLEAEGHRVELYPSCHAFLRLHGIERAGLYLVDARLPGMDGISFLREMKAAGNAAHVILMTGYGDVRMAVEAMRAGAFNFLEKPIGREGLLAAIEQARGAPGDQGREMLTPDVAVRRMPGLTGRQRQVLELVLSGKPSKTIATELGLSQRTVENHRAAIMRRTGSRSIPEMVRMVLAGG